MEKTDLYTYFSQHSPPGLRNDLVNRAKNALLRGDIKTMEALAQLTPNELARVRNLGAKSLEVALIMREQYIMDKGVRKEIKTLKYN